MCLFYTCAHNYNRTSDDSATKRSKLVLPAPQISDSEIDEVVKLGVATPLVGGVMTPFLGGDASFRGGMTPRQTTPRQTPFQTPTPTPARTPVRDQLSINTDIPVESFDDVNAVKQQQLEIQAQLKAGLGSLPAPKNDFEIVLPEIESPVEDQGASEVIVEDAADVKEKDAMQKRAIGKKMN